MSCTMFQVCNHSELFERREIKSPFFMKTESYHLPKLIYQEGNFAYLVSNSKESSFFNLCSLQWKHLHLLKSWDIFYFCFFFNLQVSMKPWHKVFKEFCMACFTFSLQRMSILQFFQVFPRTNCVLINAKWRECEWFWRRIPFYFVEESSYRCFSFTRFVNLSPKEIMDYMFGGLIVRYIVIC